MRRRAGSHRTPGAAPTRSNDSGGSQARQLGCGALLDDVTYYVGHETIVHRERGAALPVWQETLFAAMVRNASHVTDYFRLPSRQVVEIGPQSPPWVLSHLWITHCDATTGSANPQIGQKRNSPAAEVMGAVPAVDSCRRWRPKRDIHDGQGRQRPTQARDTEAQDLSPPFTHIGLTTWLVHTHGSLLDRLEKRNLCFYHIFGFERGSDE